MEANVGIVEARRELDELVAEQTILNGRIGKAKAAVVKALSRQKFRCLKCGASAYYGDTTLYLSYWTEKGLGYSDDEEHFGEYHIVCSGCGVHHRFLEQDVMDKYGIPYEIKDHYGRMKPFQAQYRTDNCDVDEFRGKFRETVSGSDRARYSFVNVTLRAPRKQGTQPKANLDALFPPAA